MFVVCFIDSGEEDFQISSYFHLCHINYPLGKKTVTFIWPNLNPLYPRMFCAYFDWNWPNESGEENFKKSSIYVHYFITPSGKMAGTFIWINLNLHFPRILCEKFGSIWAYMVLKKKTLKKFSMYVCLFFNRLLFKRAEVFILPIWILFTQE